MTYLRSSSLSKGELGKEISYGKLKAGDLIALQVQLADAIKVRSEMEKKNRDMKDELTNAQNDLWNMDKLLCLTRNQLEVSKPSLKVSLKRSAQRTRTTSVALATIVTSKG